MDVSYDISTTRTTTVTIDAERAAEIIRKAIKAPEGASVDFDCGYEFLREITVQWTETN